MEVLLAIVISVLFAFALRKQIKRYAVSFYIVAAAADVLFLSGVLFGVSREFAAAAVSYTHLSSAKLISWRNGNAATMHHTAHANPCVFANRMTKRDANQK